MKYKIALVKGDGIGPEIVDAAVKVLDRVGDKFGHSFTYTDVLAGGCAIDAVGEPLPKESVELCLSSDAVILGAVGGPKWDTLPGHLRPEKALLGLRSAMGLYANIRPAVLHEALLSECPLKESIARDGIDMVIVRELTGGIYFGERGRGEGPMGPDAYDTERYSVAEISRIGRIAFGTAMKRRKKLVSVDKANVLESSRLWREIMHSLAAEYPEVEYSDMLVDNAAMQLIRKPSQFDVIVTSNMFGDILSDEASMLTGSIGLLPSASLGSGKLGMYEPIHGSAPDITGKNIANPIATVLSCAMMLRYSFGLEEEALCIENAVSMVLKAGHRTADILGESNAAPLTTTQMTEKIIENI
ncbi:MAG TPA: 3-isopropylmalate dehydrogenase [Clostridiales bacterium]|nr:3-isopropylmalate dehydrogenase [Clostridiales bacterium]